jgi:hypothetical protein
LVHGSDADATIADRGGYPFDRAVPDVAGRKHAGHGGLQRERRSRFPAARSGGAGRNHVGTGEDEAVLVALDAFG